MVLRFYNTLTRRKEVFRPLKDRELKMYNCGPTVYDYAHIGNFRAYLFADILRRYLEYRGYRVLQVMNITDVGHMTVDDVADAAGEDKIEKKAREQKKDPWEISEYYTKAFFEDVKRMNIKPAMVYPKATEHIPEMIEMIKTLIEKGHAYVSNGSVYYDVTSFPDYGKLSGNTLDNLKAGAGGRAEDNPDKRNPFDFALWVRNPKHIMQWDSPWGRGYPGWHIECSAMSHKYLGETLDIHTGGEDNIFPHHDCEIAQSEGATGKRFVRYWMHTRHLLVNGKKMSKSLGNFYTIRDLVEKGYEPLAIRYLLISAHYRTKLNFTEDSLNAAKKTLDKIRHFIENLSQYTSGKKDNGKVENIIKVAKKKFQSSMDDDLNVPEALSAIFDMMNSLNSIMSRKEMSTKDARKVYEVMMDFDDVLGLNLSSVAKSFIEESARAGKRLIVIKYVGVEPREEIMDMIVKREEHRQAREWKAADNIREELKEMGFILEDDEKGVVIRKA